MPRPSLLLACLLAACASDAASRAAAAASTVAAFERALRAGDRGALRELVTAESRPALDHLPLQGVAGRPPLRILETVARDGDVLVRVHDPGAGGDGAFVVVKEDGAPRIDLVATAGLTARERPLPGPRERLVVRPLSPEERARAAAIAPR